MKLEIVILILAMCFSKDGVTSLSFPGPRVYVVTPSARPSTGKGKPDAPFYYRNWIRRMDSEPEVTTTTVKTSTTSPPKVKTPDLIFAEFDSDGSKQKSIRKLLENERILPKKTTMRPIYIPDEDENKVTRVVNYGLPVKVDTKNETSTENNYSFISNNDYYNTLPAPVYLPASISTAPSTTAKPTTATVTQSPINIQNVWHIIDSEKSNANSGRWEEISLGSNDENNDQNKDTENNSTNDNNSDEPKDEDNNSQHENYDDDVTLNENFALPGFGTNTGSGAENESRAIRTEPNIRFPYINLKPFQMKPSKKLTANSKKTNSFTTLDNFYALKNPVRGEAQDIVPVSSSVDRYNPAQPYLPQQPYGSKQSKQSSPDSGPPKATANLVPPPPPPPPKFTGDDFPAPVSYESFPPYAPSSPGFNSAPAAPSPPQQPPSSASFAIKPSQSIDVSDDSDDSGTDGNDSGPDMGAIYGYKPPASSADSDTAPPAMSTSYRYKAPSDLMPFYPTPPPPSVPFKGYSYSKPSMMADSPPIAADKPDFHGYHYSKPESPPPEPPSDMPPSYGYHSAHDDDHHPIHIYSHDDAPPHSHESDYPNFSYGDKPHDDKPGDDMKDMGMSPPAPSADMKPDMYGPPSDDHGFPSDFPTDFKFHHDFDDHDHYHHHHTTTTTTETPRVNRFSYYYLGKKLYYLPLYFSVYFIIYVGALIIKAVLRHKIVYPNSWRPNTTTASFFSKRSVDEYLSHDNLHHLTKRVTDALAIAAEKYMDRKTIVDKNLN